MLLRIWIGLLVLSFALAGCSPAPVVTPTPDVTIVTPALPLAQRALAARLGVELEQVTVVSVKQVEYMDGCLGAGGIAESCLQAVTPGFEIMLLVDGEQYEYRAPLDGSFLRPYPAIDEQAGPPDLPGLTWERTGGIAGFCDVLEISSNGLAVASDCQGNTLVTEHLTGGQLDYFLNFAFRYAPFSYAETDGAVADSMTTQMTLHGLGTEPVTDIVQMEMFNFASALYLQLTGETSEGTVLTPVAPVEPVVTEEAEQPGVISGRMCYPSEFIPAMTAYFLNVLDESYTLLPIAMNQMTYTVALPAGEYVAFAYVDEYQLGGGYSQAMVCYQNTDQPDNCTDHSLRTVFVRPGEEATDVDLCDWILEGLPLP